MDFYILISFFYTIDTLKFNNSSYIIVQRIITAKDHTTEYINMQFFVNNHN